MIFDTTKATNAVRLLLVFSVLFLASCGGGGSSSEQPTPPPVVVDNQPVAVDDVFTTDQDVTLSADVSTNDTGLQDQPITYETISGPASGELSFSSNGQFTYVPATGFNGDITFQYRVTDSDGDTDTATVSITVNRVNAVPVANDDNYSTAQNQVLNGDVSLNDTGLDDTPVIYSLVSGPSSGELTLATDGSFSYTPLSTFAGTTGFTYQVVDNDGDTDAAEVVITVTAVVNSGIWPSVNSEAQIDVEADIQTLLTQMTTEEKVGQLIMAEIQSVTPEDVKNYNLGAVLNGGGSWPNTNGRATVTDWLNLAEQFYQASVDVSDGGVGIPVIWGTDAVHGHNNVFGATLLPHNIGLGAANNPELMKEIGRLTALQVTATGIDWTFAPTVATVRDDRWGRTYESYSEEPDRVAALTANIVRGLQGEIAADSLFSDDRIIATAKHFIGDGGTTSGVDQGNTQLTEEQLRDIHGPGFFAALEAGAQTVMASYNSWNGDKLHGNEYLLTDVLRDQIGFDGLVVGDWNGHAQVNGCGDEQCARAINAGVDMIMVPYAWRDFYNNTLADVRSGAISMARLDEAVTRILRVKLRAGLFQRPAPVGRVNAGDGSLLASEDIKNVARQAVRESLVLLKNKDNILPLSRDQRILVAGSGADNIGQQTGGWSYYWQGSVNNNQDYPEATSIYAGIQQAVTDAGGTVILNVNGNYSGATPDVAIVVFGEEPYAEGAGDIPTVEYQAGNKTDLELLQRLQGQGIPVVSIFLSGRPMWVNAELNASNAFVAAWLPGTEGDGIAEVIFRDNSGAIANDFSGKLSFSWPIAATQTPLNSDDTNYAPLFEVGYGLTYQDTDTLGDDLDESGVIPGGGEEPVVFNVPAETVEAEQYSAMSGIQLETTTDTGGGQNIGYIDVGDWVEYEIDVAESGTYEMQYRLASLPGSAGFTTSINGIEQHTMAVAETADWQNWVTQTIDVDLTAGRQTLRLDAIGALWNLNWIRFVAK